MDTKIGRVMTSGSRFSTKTLKLTPTSSFYSKTSCFVSVKFSKLSISVSTFIIVCICAHNLNCVKVSSTDRTMLEVLVCESLIKVRSW